MKQDCRECLMVLLRALVDVHPTTQYVYNYGFSQLAKLSYRLCR